ncbi:MAG: 30S ribosomal protein S9 [Bacteroidetes Order II. Incertae sedis bacterium]|nr:30S ribosomal protein S9 [Bacteroidetes Order II. bacterium]
MASPVQYIAVGRRKTSVARVYLRPGTGNMTINKRDLQNYFPVRINQMVVQMPLKVAALEGQFDVVVNTKGGGTKGQSEAIRLGISRALVKFNEDLKKPLRDAGFLTRDPRAVERKKYGKPKARKRFQFSKR